MPFKEVIAMCCRILFSKITGLCHRAGEGDGEMEVGRAQYSGSGVGVGVGGLQSPGHPEGLGVP